MAWPAPTTKQAQRQTAHADVPMPQTSKGPLVSGPSALWAWRLLQLVLHWVSSGADPAEEVRGAALAEPDLERYTIRLPGSSHSQCPGTNR